MREKKKKPKMKMSTHQWKQWPQTKDPIIIMKQSAEDNFFGKSEVPSTQKKKLNEMKKKKLKNKTHTYM